MGTKTQSSSGNLVLRSVFMDPEVDETLRQEAFKRNVSKNDLFRKYLQIGMDAVKNKRTPVDLSGLTQREKPKPTYAADLLIKEIEQKLASQPAARAKKTPVKNAVARKSAVKKVAAKKAAAK